MTLGWKGLWKGGGVLDEIQFGLKTVLYFLFDLVKSSIKIFVYYSIVIISALGGIFLI